MKFDQAKAVAGKEAGAFVADPTVKCPVKKTGLLVVVYREDNNEAIGDADVETTRDTWGGLSSEKQNKKTDPKDGIARFKPTKPASYTVTSPKPLPDETFYLPPPVQAVSVAEGTCPICEIPVKLLSKPSIKVVQKSDNKGVQGVGVTVETTKIAHPDTDAAGLSKFPDKTRGVVPGKYTVTLTFKGPNAKKYQVIGGDNKPRTDMTIGPLNPKEEETFTFVVKEVTWISFRVVHQISATESKEISAAELKLKLPGAPSATTHSTLKGADMTVSDAIAAFCGDLDLPKPTDACQIESIELPPEKADIPEVYEFIEMTAA